MNTEVQLSKSYLFAFETILREFLKYLFICYLSFCFWSWFFSDSLTQRLLSNESGLWARRQVTSADLLRKCCELSIQSD